MHLPELPMSLERAPEFFAYPSTWAVHRDPAPHTMPSPPFWVCTISLQQTRKVAEEHTFSVKPLMNRALQTQTQQLLKMLYLWGNLWVTRIFQSVIYRRVLDLNLNANPNAPPILESTHYFSRTLKISSWVKKKFYVIKIYHHSFKMLSDRNIFSDTYLLYLKWTPL